MYIKKYDEKKVSLSVFVLTVILFSSFYLYRSSLYSSIILATISIIIFMFLFIINKGKIILKLSKFHYYILLMVIYFSINTIFSISPKETIVKCITLIEISICLTIVYWGFYSKTDGFDKLIQVIMWSGYIVMFYTIFTYGTSLISLALLSGNRLESEFNNVNEIASLCVLAIVISIYYVLKEGFKISTLLIIPAFLLIIACGSKRAIIQLIACLSTVFILKRKQTNNHIWYLKVTLFISLMLVIIVSLNKNGIFTGVSERFGYLFSYITGSGSIDHSTVFRSQMITYGLELFYNRPILGIGIGCSHIKVLSKFGMDVYLHNNYVELLAGGGIIAFGLYYSIYMYLVKKVIKYRKRADNIITLVSVILVFLVISDYASATYYSKDVYFLLLVCFVGIELLRTDSKNIRE